ncbi:MAG: hypothetical protein AAGD96_01660 [Chloroflexota bacterium]
MLAVEAPSADLAAIYGRHTGNIPQRTIDPIQWEVGDTDSFFYTEQANETVVETTARVVYVSDKLIMWLEEGVRVNDRVVQEAAVTLEQEVFPTTREIFGREPTSGIDQNPAIHILHIGDMGGNTIGYFSGKDGYTRDVSPLSNEREMFYINLDFVSIGDRDYYDVVSHEFLHMLQWAIDRNEDTWLNEGLAELSTTLNGYGASDFLSAYLRNPDTSLTAFRYNGGDYGAAWLFASWLYDQYGAEFIGDLVSQPQNGIAGVDALLNSYRLDQDFLNIYADWMVAVYSTNHNLPVSAEFKFDTVDRFFVRVPKIDPVTPQQEEAILTTVGQFGSDYWQIPADQAYELTIEPSQQVQLFDTQPFSGSWIWSTLPADFSDMHLTHPIDLSDVETATLEYKTWYDIEVGYDYAYVSISADGGLTWDTLLTTASVNSDPHGKNIGNGITGFSGGGNEPVWVAQSANLSEWAGQANLLLRFEYITDDAVQHAGMAIDDISIPEVNWFDDFENGNGDWESAGFARHTNVLPQTFIVQTLAILGDDPVQVVPHQPDKNGVYTIEIEPAENQSETILAIAGTTPITFQSAAYQITLKPKP